MGNTAYRKIQIGLESTSGTAVAADTVLYGSMTMVPEVVYHRPVDERQSLALYRRAVATQHNATMRYQGDALFEQILQFLSMTLRGGISATTPTGGTASRDWTFIPNTASANSQDSFTFEYGDDNQFWESSFVVCSSMELQITMGEVVQLTADMFGRYAITTSKTGSLSETAVNEVLADGARIFIDTTWSNVGDTEFNTILAGGTIRLNSGLVPVRYADGLDSSGNATFSTVIENRRSHSMDLDIIANATGVAQVYNAYRDNTDRSIRIVFDLAANSIESGKNHELEIDMFGKFTSPPELFGEREGENVFRVTFTSYDDGSGNEVSVRVRNKVTAI